MTERDDLKTAVEEAEKIGMQIVPILTAAAPEVAALVLCDLLAAWILLPQGNPLPKLQSRLQTRPFRPRTRGTLMSKKSKAADDFSERMLAIHAREVEALERIADRIAGIAHILAAAPILGREPTVKTK